MNLGQELDDGVLQSGAQELSSELIRHPELLKTLFFRGRLNIKIIMASPKRESQTNLCVDSGFDDVNHHVCSDGVGFEIKGTDCFVGLKSFELSQQSYTASN